ncbi:MAG TPA: class I tRNA ligase family protein, partial [Armatimonadota bacterium]|nr:class I tRNA ligase family protein [Armatimonadota bacterium]
GFDIHGGGQDLIFPHHENEIAQSEAALGQQTFARFWLHNGFVTINREKMSKSLGNFFTVREVLARYSAPVVRYFLTATHYRSPLDFSDQTLDQAKGAYERLKTGVFTMQRVIAGAQSADAAPAQCEKLRALTAAAEDDFRIAMDDDFNTPQAIAVLFGLVGEANRLVADPGFVPDAAALTALSDARALVLRLAEVLGITLADGEAAGDSLAPRLMDLLIALRAQVRQEKQYALADLIRNRLNEIGILLEDTPQGTTWRRK